MSPAEIFLYGVALIGHTAIWVGLINRLHAVGLPRKRMNRLTVAAEACHLLIPLVYVWHIAVLGGARHAEDDRGLFVSYALSAYFLLSLAFAAIAAGRWLAIRVFRRTPAVLRRCERETIDLSAANHDEAVPRIGRLICALPLNEALRLEVNEKSLEIPRLPEKLDGLSIAHVSDLHFTGRVGKRYFLKAIDRTIAMQADLIAVTGDILEKADCFDWIADTLGRLRAPHGVYFILGNHDLKIDHARLRHDLTEAGLVDLGGRSITIEVDGQPVVLAGNELPWVPGWKSEAEGQASEVDSRVVKILLSHSPDQITWARQRNFDLVLAGHTHGGQICFPIVGPIACPSLFGVKYACGVFHEPPTAMHVSRGLSSELPLRWNCLPEITKVILRCPARAFAGSETAELSGMSENRTR